MMFHVAPAGPVKHGSAAGHGWLMGDAVARTTWRTSFAVSGYAISPRWNAAMPSATTSAATPALSGVPVEVEPSVLGTENSACGPYEVRLERDSNVVSLSTHGQNTELLLVGGVGHVVPLRVEWSPLSELPGQTLA